MALIRKGKKGRDDGGYTRLLGSSELGALISRTHGASISAGTELERILLDRCTVLGLPELEAFLDAPVDGVFVVRKSTIKKSPVLRSKQEPDVLVLRVCAQERLCFVVELKDGDAFDTKKAEGEKNSLYAYRDHIAAKIPFKVVVRVCAFNAADRDAIVKGFKERITEEEAMTGRELCDLLGVDFDAIVALREMDQAENFTFFLDALLAIAEVREHLSGKIGRPGD